MKKKYGWYLAIYFIRVPFKTITWRNRTNEKEKCCEKLSEISSKILPLVKNYFIWYVFYYCSKFNHYLKRFKLKD